MPATAHPRRNSDRIAVIRSYRPIRIEHELLAQVFDLAQRGLADGSASVGGKLLAADQTADQAADERVRDRMQHGALDPGINRQVSRLEAVA